MRAIRKKAKPGEVLFFYGKLPGDSPDHLGMWGGAGATKRHSNAVMRAFTMQRVEPGKGWGEAWRLGSSFLADLDAAGFDTTTLRFSIRVKTPPTQAEGGE